MKPGTTRAAAGIAVAGLVVALPLVAVGAKVLRPLLFGVSPTDVPVIATATLVVAVVTTLAAWFPARQVTRINPAIALR